MTRKIWTWNGKYPIKALCKNVLWQIDIDKVHRLEYKVHSGYILPPISVLKGEETKAETIVPAFKNALKVEQVKHKKIKTQLF